MIVLCASCSYFFLFTSCMNLSFGTRSGVQPLNSTHQPFWFLFLFFLSQKSILTPGYSFTTWILVASMTFSLGKEDPVISNRILDKTKFK